MTLIPFNSHSLFSKNWINFQVWAKLWNGVEMLRVILEVSLLSPVEWSGQGKISLAGELIIICQRLTKLCRTWPYNSDVKLNPIFALALHWLFVEIYDRLSIILKRTHPEFNSCLKVNEQVLITPLSIRKAFSMRNLSQIQKL